MSSHDVQVGDNVFYYEWVPAQESHTKFRATVRVLPGGGSPHQQHRPVHLTVTEGETGPSGFRNVNNVSNIEQISDLSGEDYWTWQSRPE